MTNTLLSAASGTSESSLLFVCFFGIAVVFLGLFLLIGLIELMNLVISKFSKAEKSVAPETTSAVPKTPMSESEIQNKEELVAAICCAVAEEEGVDVSALRVISFKKIN